MIALKRRHLLGATAAAGVFSIGRARADEIIRIGVLNDQSGPYRDTTGLGSVVCARQAADEFSAATGMKVEVLAADHQNKPDVGAAVVRQWFDRDGVDLLLDVPTSSVALAVANVAREKNRTYVNCGGGTPDLTGEQCTANTVHWVYDTYMLSRSTAGQITRMGGKKWFFITADYVFGHQLERDAGYFVKQGGGQVVGAARYPFPATADFASQLVAAQASGADIVGIAAAGGDAVNIVKQAAEFGLTSTMKLAALLMQPADVEAAGLELAAGLFLTGSFYWDMNDGTRELTKRVLDRMPHRIPPNMIHAGCYAGALHFLKAVKTLGASQKSDGRAVVAQMKAMPTEDIAFGKGSIRADGRALFPAYLFKVKTAKASKSKWDMLELVATTPASEAWRPMSEGGCALVKG